MTPERRAPRLGSSLVFLVAIAACGEQAAAPAPATGNDAPVTQPPPSPEPPPAVSGPQPSPAPSDSPPTQCAGPSPGPGFECIRNCGPPVARQGDPDPGWSWASPDLVKNRKRFGCPICLPDDARIATPTGDVAISSLAPGALVWSTTADGKRVARRVEHVVSVAAPPEHRIALIELEDGRRLRASPGHPDAAGHPVGDLTVGDALDGSRVRRVTLVPYTRRTFDLVLEGGATTYITDGVLVRSTITPR